MKYFIDFVNGSGSGCDQTFNSIEDAKNHMSFWSEKDKVGCVIVPIED